MDHIKSRVPKQNVVVIGNVVPQYDVTADLQAEKEHHKIIFIGRLVKNHKRPHLLIKAFTKLADCFPNWELELWGAESNRTYTKSLQHRIEKSGLQSRIHLKGVTRDVAGVLRDGDIFVLPSAYEGFGLSLAEAMSMGLPAIGYQECPAVNELIEDGKNGLLCANGVDALAEALQKLMSDKELRTRYGINAKQSVAKYASEKIWGAWEALLKQTLK